MEKVVNLDSVVRDIANFSWFVNQSESFATNYSEYCSELYDNWWEMEILNASALFDWESENKPEYWEKWDVQYKKKAIDLVVKFLASKEQATNKYWHQYDDIVKNISSFSEFILQERNMITPYSNLYELWWEMDNFSNAIVDIWQQSNKPNVWDKWEAIYKKEALLLLDAFMITKKS